MIILVSLLVCLLMLFIYWFSAYEFRDIAELKGYDGGKYFWWCFLTGVIGWAMVIALPDRKSKDLTVGSKESVAENKVLKTVNELPEL